MTHSQMVQTRRKKQKIRKNLANAAKREKKLAKQGVRATDAGASKPTAPAPA